VLYYVHASGNQLQTTAFPKRYEHRAHAPTGEGREKAYFFPDRQMLFKRQNGIRWLVVFLGNPGKQYDNTRHNAGFMAADAMETLVNVRIDRLRHRALTARCEIGGMGVLLMKPQTFMNLSGESVADAAAFYKVAPENIIVVSDETALPVGAVRIRQKGSAGGHNGLKNIIRMLGTENFPRIRLGVGTPVHHDFDMKDWVLSGFMGQDAADMKNAAKCAAEAVLCYIENGPDKAMNRFNTNSR